MEPTTISQALRKAAKLRGQIKEHMERAAASNVWEAGSPPAFDLADSLSAADGAIGELVAVETAIRLANAAARVQHDGRLVTLTEATCLLREIKGRIAWLKTLPARAHVATSESSLEYDDDMKRRTVVKNYCCAMPQAQIATMISVEQAKFDLLDDAVEAANHKTMLPL